jgi:multidrug efflux pump subunit AcrB
MVPLSSFVTVDRATGPQFKTRFNLFSSAEVTGQAAPGYSSGEALKALEEVAQKTLGPDYGHAWSALSYQQAKAALPQRALARRGRGRPALGVRSALSSARRRLVADALT